MRRLPSGLTTGVNSTSQDPVRLNPVRSGRLAGALRDHNVPVPRHRGETLTPRSEGERVRPARVDSRDLLSCRDLPHADDAVGGGERDQVAVGAEGGAGENP